MPLYFPPSGIIHDLGLLTKDIYLDSSLGTSQVGVVDSIYALAVFSLSDLPTEGDQFTLTDWNNNNTTTFTYVASPSVEPTDISLTNLDTTALTVPQLLTSTLNAITTAGWTVLTPGEGDTQITIRQTNDGPLGNQENSTTNVGVIHVDNFAGGGVLNLYSPINGEYGQSIKLTLLNGNGHVITVNALPSENGSWIFNETQELGPGFEIAPYRAITFQTDQVFPFYNLWSFSNPTGAYNID